MGKKLAIWGDSITAQIFFAMGCDLATGGLLPPDFFWRRGLGGVMAPSLGLNITLLDHGTVEKAFCSEQRFENEREIKRYRQQFGHAAGTVRWVEAGGQWWRPCEQALRSIITQFDIVIVNFGLHYQQRPTISAPEVGVYSRDLSLAVSAFERAAFVEPQKRFVIVETAAQHFRGTTRSGAFEERNPGAVDPDRCHCNPTGWELGWRNVALHRAVSNATNTRLLPFYNLTQPRWDMHVAHSTQQHAGDASIKPKPVCDCTHFCFDRSFWQHDFFPSLDSVLRGPPSKVLLTVSGK